jgi:predicted ABC-class ATPase
MGRVRGQQIATRDQLDPSLVYAAQIRLRIDTAQLPKPFQISSIGSKTWNLSSDWYRWTVKP